MRDFLAGQEPATASANAEFTLFKNAHDVMEASREAQRARPSMFRKTMGRMTGAAVGGASGGGVGAVAGIAAAEALEAIASSGVTTKIQTARLLANLADALRANRTAQATALVNELRRFTTAAKTSSVAAGRLQTATAAR
jgi:hypothetical protein